jgi:hypothetical protein
MLYNIYLNINENIEERIIRIQLERFSRLRLLRKGLQRSHRKESKGCSGSTPFSKTHQTIRQQDKTNHQYLYYNKGGEVAVLKELAEASNIDYIFTTRIFDCFLTEHNVTMIL